MPTCCRTACGWVLLKQRINLFNLLSQDWLSNELQMGRTLAF